MNRRIAIIGGGLAGLAAAIRVAEAGDQPIVIESRKRLGGRATSFVDPRTGELLDNCQHVVMGCCTNLLDLYARLEVLDRIDWHRTLYWGADGLDEDDADVMSPCFLPAPAHFTGAFARMKLLTQGEKHAVARALWRIIRLGIGRRHAWSDRSFAEFLKEQAQPPRTIERFWNVIIVSACNMDVERVCAAHALKVFQEGFLAHRFAAAMGLPNVPLVELYDPAEAMIQRAGGEIRLGLSAMAIAYDGSRVTGVVTDEGVIEASAIVSTVPPDRLDKLASDVLKRADARLRALDRFSFSPILGVHLMFPQQVMKLPHLILPGAGVQWVFNKGMLADGRQHLHAVISAADAWMELPEAEIVERVCADLARFLPRSRGLAPSEYRSVKEKRATFAAGPGIDRLRPAASPTPIGAQGRGVSNLFLAGDWCDTGWPATMEGAVRSGYTAAAALTGAGGLVSDLPVSWLARRLGLT